ncbi:MAG: hypothetical protein Q8R60_17250 [Mycobacteriales bacterium]|nr:hypothetical protein [Mycobacteriales bacterium]
MGLDDLLSSSGDGPVSERAAARDRARDRRRTLLLGGTAVLVAVGLGVGVGLVAAALGGGEPRTLTATPGSSPSVVRPSSSAPTPRPTPTASAAPTPSATPSVDAPASGTDIGYLVASRETSADGAALSVSFDRVQFFTGEAARREADKRGDEIENDYYVVNDNTRLRTLVVADGATVTGDSSFNSWAGDGGSGQRPRTLDELARFVRTDQGRETLFDLRYDAQGRVTAVAERYLP